MVSALRALLVVRNADHKGYASWGSKGGVSYHTQDSNGRTEWSNHLGESRRGLFSLEPHSRQRSSRGKTLG